MSTLFILMKSPYEYHDLDTVAALGGEERIGIMLFEDAVLFPVYKEKRDEVIDVADDIYVLADDLEARGFKGRTGPGFEVIEYPRAIDLIMEEYDQTITL